MAWTSRPFYYGLVVQTRGCLYTYKYHGMSNPCLPSQRSQYKSPHSILWALLVMPTILPLLTVVASWMPGLSIFLVLWSAWTIQQRNSGSHGLVLCSHTLVCNASGTTMTLPSILYTSTAAGWPCSGRTFVWHYGPVSLYLLKSYNI